jgi:hypothetical protein
VGSGYFAERELFIFGDESLAGRDSLLEWNSKNYWRKILPSPIDGGPVFFAENCFGSQLGFRWQEGCATGYFLDVDTCEAFKVSDSLDELFGSVLTDRYALTNPELLVGVRAVVGGLADGMHYAPIVSPLVGGRSIPGNYHLETANVHLRTSIATWEATRTGE